MYLLLFHYKGREPPASEKQWMAPNQQKGKTKHNIKIRKTAMSGWRQ